MLKCARNDASITPKNNGSFSLSLKNAFAFRFTVRYSTVRCICIYIFEKMIDLGNVVGSQFVLQFLKKIPPTTFVSYSLSAISIFQAAVTRLGLNFALILEQIGAIAFKQPVCVISHHCENILFDALCSGCLDGVISWQIGACANYAARLRFFALWRSSSSMSWRRSM